MIVLGLDQAPTGIGFAYGEPGSKPTFGWHELPDYGDNTARLGKSAREWTIKTIKSTGAEWVYFEEIFVRTVGLDLPVLLKQMTVLCNIETACEMCGLSDTCFVTDIDGWRGEFYAGVRARKNKSETASQVWKQMAVTECARRNWFTDNHNAAEACGIWDWGCKVADKAYRLRSRVGKRRQQSEQDAARAAG